MRIKILSVRDLDDLVAPRLDLEHPCSLVLRGEALSIVADPLPDRRLGHAVVTADLSQRISFTHPPNYVGSELGSVSCFGHFNLSLFILPPRARVLRGNSALRLIFISIVSCR